MWRSVPQMEATWTFTRTSVGPYLGMGTWRTSAPLFASGFTTASIVDEDISMRVPSRNGQRMARNSLFYRRLRKDFSRRLVKGVREHICILWLQINLD